MVNRADIQKEIEEIQALLKQKTTMNIPKPNLTKIPHGPNISRTSNDMWKIYQYRKAQYERLQTLPSEREFLHMICNMVTGTEEIKTVIQDRLSDLECRDRIDVPCVEIPLTTLSMLSWDEKVAKAKSIAQHIAADMQRIDPETVMTEITRLQNRLMELEEAYLSLE